MNKKEIAQDKILIADKLNYILDTYMSASNVTKKFGFNSNSMISSMRNRDKAQTLLQVHQEGLEKHYNIPITIWNKNVPMDKNIIDNIIKNYKKEDRVVVSPFTQNNELLNKLVGTWYSYFYSSQEVLKIHSIETIINKNCVVSDENKNSGKLFIGTNQSMIIKESINSKNLVSITFTNTQVAYGIFVFSLVSKQDQINDEMFNFGFFSKKELDKDVVIKTLGDINTTQLKMDRGFLERIRDIS
jgi:hypothetical protein